MDEIELSETLKNLRKQQNLSQEALADLLHVSRQSLSKWERGEATPDIYSLNKLANLYKITLDDLVNGNIANSKIVPYIDKLLKQEDVKRPNFNIYVTILGILATVFCAMPYSLIAGSGIYFLEIQYFYISFWVLVPPVILFIRLLRSGEHQNNYYFTLYLISFICSVIVLFFLSSSTLMDMHSILVLLSIIPVLTYILSHTKTTYKLELDYKSALINVFAFSAIAFQLFAFLSEPFYSDITISAILAASMLSFFVIYLALKKQAGVFTLNIIALVVSAIGFIWALAILNSMFFIIMHIITIVLPVVTIILNLSLKREKIEK